MYTNLIELVLPRTLSRFASKYRVKDPLTQTHPLQTGQPLAVYENLLYKAYSVERNLENIPFLLSKSTSDSTAGYLESRRDTYAIMQADYREMMLSHVKRDYLRGQRYSIELASNLLYLLAAYDIQSKELAEEALSVIQDKQLENASLQNLSDMYVYLRRFGDSQAMLAEVETLMRNKVAQKQPVSVKPSGNSIKYFCAIDADSSLSQLEESVLGNSSFRNRFEQMLNSLIFRRQLELGEIWEPVSDGQERRRVRSLLGLPADIGASSD